jgi:hypothetical protein
MAVQAHEAMGTKKIEVIADRGYYSGREILAYEQAGIKTYIPKNMTSNGKAAGRFSKLDFVYLAKDDEYRCPAGKQLVLHHWTIEHEMKINVYYASGCQTCALKRQCTTGTERRVRRCEHEAVLDAMQKRLDRKPDQMLDGASTKTLMNVSTEMSLHVLAYNLKRVMQILGIAGTIRPIRMVGA